jgi:cobalt/nickel transport system permease protein
MTTSSLRMHIPDGFLSTLVAIFFWVASIIIIAIALRRLNRDLGERQIPLMGVLAAAIFAGQMLNFSVAGGTSGHLLGAALATILLGPWAAVIVMTCVVSIQALIFQDGGLLALGANIFNMAVIGVSVSHFIFSSLRRLSAGKTWGLFAGGFLAAWVSVFIASLAVALELSISGTSPANISIPTMGGIHALIGLGEAAITLGALTFLHAARRDLFLPQVDTTSRSPLFWIIGMGIALGLAILSPLASTHPDGLEWVAEQQGFLDAARAPVFRLIPDYVFPFFKDPAASTIAAGILGTLLVLGVVLGMARWRRKKNG